MQLGKIMVLKLGEERREESLKWCSSSFSTSSMLYRQNEQLSDREATKDGFSKDLPESSHLFSLYCEVFLCYLLAVCLLHLLVFKLKYSL